MIIDKRNFSGKKKDERVKKRKWHQTSVSPVLFNCFTHGWFVSMLVAPLLKTGAFLTLYYCYPICYSSGYKDSVENDVVHYWCALAVINRKVAF